MNRRATLAVTTTALLCMAVGLSASDSVAQQKSLKEQLVGAWTLVSSDQVRPDGSKLKQFGANPKGINVFDANGRFFLMVASADNSQIASKDPSKTTSEEDGLIVESIAYYGTYTVNEEVNVISLHLEPDRNRSKTSCYLSHGGRTEVQQPCCDIWRPSPSSMEASRIGVASSY